MFVIFFSDSSYENFVVAFSIPSTGFAIMRFNLVLHFPNQLSTGKYPLKIEKDPFPCRIVRHQYHIFKKKLSVDISRLKTKDS